MSTLKDCKWDLLFNKIITVFKDSETLLKLLVQDKKNNEEIKNKNEEISRLKKLVEERMPKENISIQIVKQNLDQISRAYTIYQR